MNIRDFEYIIAVDELKSFIKASKRCFVSQPALSMQIQKVEEIIGTKIFERTKKSILTTKEGEKIIEYARAILKNFELIKGIKNEVKSLSIGVIYSVAPFLLPKILSTVKMSFEDMVITFTEGKTKDIIQELISGKLDAVILASSEFCDLKKLAPNSNIEFAPLYQEKFFLAMQKKHPFKPKSDVITKDELLRISAIENFILLDEGHCMTENTQDVCLQYGIKLKNKTNIFTSSIETIKQMIIQGQGISLLPLLSIKKTDGINYYEMPAKDSRLISIMYRKNNSKVKTIGEIASIIKHAV